VASDSIALSSTEHRKYFVMFSFKQEIDDG